MMTVFGSRIICIHAINVQFTLAKIRNYIHRMRYLGYRFVSVEDILSSSDRRLLALTIDDAYLSIYCELLPLLEIEKVPALLFVPAGLLGRKPNEDDLLNNGMYPDEATMCIEEINQWIKSGYKIGFHTSRHIDWSIASYEEIVADFEEGWRIFKENNWHTSYFAYPFGALPRTNIKMSEELLISHGIKYAFTLEWGDLDKNSRSLYIPRVCLGDSEPGIWSVMKSLGIFDWYGNRNRV